MNIQDWFRIGMKRELPRLLPAPTGPVINLGAGNETLGIPLDLPAWDARKDPIPYSYRSVGAIFANHFFEHLTGTDAVRVLRECERVMMFGGVLNIVVPYYNSQLAAECLDHKSVWTEATWDNLFHRHDWDGKGRWHLKVHTCFILGIVERNLALFTQLVKEV